ncbi:hypothetical protein [Leptospira meyeri]|uniref:hypothetical protein n=1 Tax=Leptospira meyeri TaxID=29508 RepID=UPI00223CA1F3|nr:hypothetical protein [Leptospira meyeri]MCW7491017.1 hypothetical protein [Leptospira meyeri]
MNKKPKKTIKDNNYFNFSDAWVFESLIFSTKDDTILDFSQLIAAGDSLNHAILTLEEIKDALIKLQRKGFIQFSNNIIKYTESGKSIIKKNREIKGGLFSRIDISQKVLNSNITEQTSENNINFFDSLTEKEIHLNYIKHKKN